MFWIWVSLAVFLATYLANILMVTIGYHRGLAHNAVVLHPWVRRFVLVTGNWITGLDPKAWAVMHRLHHAHSDTAEDPHSPDNVGILGIGREQLLSYKRAIRGLKKKDPRYMRHATDFDFELNWLNLSRKWYLPYLLHVAIGVALFAATGSILLGLAWVLGMMSHPIQGGLVNSFGHALGGRNFDNPDNSRNNHLIAWFVAGEGFQNNHHRYPGSAKFSYKRHEFDPGWVFVWIGDLLRLWKIDRKRLIPSPGRGASGGLT